MNALPTTLQRAPAPAVPPATLPTAWNEYLLWLSFAVPGMLNKGNANAMAWALRHLPAETAMVEIGTFCGLSTCVLAHLRERAGITCPFFTADRWEFEGQALGTLLGDSRTVTHDGYRDFVKASYVRNARMFCGSDLPRTIESSSDEFFAAWEARASRTDVFGRTAQLGGPIGFAYIDGDHRYEAARRDFEHVDAHLVPGGHILFDDSADGSTWEVCRVIEEVKRMDRYEVIANAPNYLVRKR